MVAFAWRRARREGVCVFISKPDELVAFCERASSSKILAVDTEFLREKTYYPRLCLLQLATPDEIAAVDPIALSDLSAVTRLFADPTITKIFHACSQDIEVIDDAMGVVPTPIFDTQVAAAFLGQRMQMGYGPLVEVYTGVHLAKAESLTDWSRRPLDPEQLVYAEDDVRYLPGIYDKMISQLVERGRLAWLAPEMQAVCDPMRYRHDPREAFRHAKRVTSLTRKQLAVTREVCAWRESTAMRRDVPRKWVMTDEVAIEISKRAPRDVARLRRIRGTEQVGDRDAAQIVDAVRKGLACPADDLPKVDHHARPAAELESVIDLMYALLRLVSERSGVATQLIATRDDLYDFAVDRTTSPVSRGWRRDLLGDSLSDLLEGKVGLTVKDGHIEVL
jgi:ribonuclease D